MKLASTISRYLLGVMFTVFGANGFLHFLKAPPPSTPLGLQFLSAAAQSHFMVLIFLLQIIAGLLLLSGRFVPLALVVLGAILTNILNYHLTMDPAGIAPGIIATALWLGTLQNYRGSLSALFVAKAESTTASAATGAFNPARAR